MNSELETIYFKFTAITIQILHPDEVKRRLSDHFNKVSGICELYKRGKCPHGPRGDKPADGLASCPNSHPKRCFRFSSNGSKGKNGCTKGDKCQYFHPSICRSSLENRVCLNKECSHPHLKGTRRVERRDDNDSNKKDERSKKKGPHHRGTHRDGPSKTVEVPVKRVPASENDHFLELKDMVMKMNSRFDEEIAAIREFQKSLMQSQRPPHVQVPGPNMMPMPAMMPMYHNQFIPRY